MNRVFNLRPKHADYMDNDCITVSAKDETEALELAEGEFHITQGEIRVEEIDLNISQIINISNVGA